eukprot:2577581-Rhodomonas_salina.3
MVVVIVGGGGAWPQRRSLSTAEPVAAVAAFMRRDLQVCGGLRARRTYESGPERAGTGQERGNYIQFDHVTRAQSEPPSLRAQSLDAARRPLPRGGPGGIMIMNHDGGPWFPGQHHDARSAGHWQPASEMRHLVLSAADRVG